MIRFILSKHSGSAVLAGLFAMSFLLLSGHNNGLAAQAELNEQAQPSAAAAYLFGRPHLDAITQPAVLRYRFARTSVAGDGFEDTIDIRVDAIRNAGRRDTSLVFFTGKRQRPYPDMTDYLGNPLVIMFLQRDVWELSRTRGGQARYFRYRIRQALRETATVQPETIDTEHGVIAAHRITITPYKDDRYRRRLDEFEFKAYEFVVSPDVPGEIYMIRTLVPAAATKGADAPPLIVETVVFEKKLAHQEEAAE